MRNINPEIFIRDYCRYVKDFTVGNYYFASIMFKCVSVNETFNGVVFEYDNGKRIYIDLDESE